jgi:hypothetical protein
LGITRWLSLFVVQAQIGGEDGFDQLPLAFLPWFDPRTGWCDSFEADLKPVQGGFGPKPIRKL